MTRLERNKLNHLVSQMPHGLVLTLPWLKQQGVSCKLAWWYVQSHWLERVGDEAYKKPGEKINWVGALASVQNQLCIPVHVGAKTALELLGQSHFIPVHGIRRVILFNSSNTKAPRWFSEPNSWDVNFLINKTTLFHNEDSAVGVMSKEIDGININLSSPERAVLEILSLVPHKQSFDEASKIIESLSQLRPSLVQTLLEKCKSIKTKRLLLHFADTFQHPWFKKLDLIKIDLGSGKRVIGQGGNYDSKYKISVPKIMEE